MLKSKNVFHILRSSSFCGFMNAPQPTNSMFSQTGFSRSAFPDNINLQKQLEKFRKELSAAKHVVALTGAGISAESGISTFRGAGGFWGRYDVTQLATYDGFVGDTSLVWRFYAYRRENVLQVKPNAGHVALAELEKHFEKLNRRVSVITQNIDGLHQRAGSKNVIEIHGSLFKTQCTKCGKVEENRNVPISPGLKDPKLPDPDEAEPAKIADDLLPRCSDCKGLLRPHVVWFGENLDEKVMDSAWNELNNCDLCLLVGTSSIVYPAAMFAPSVASRGVSVAEFNLEITPGSDCCKYMFIGPSGLTLPNALNLAAINEKG